jgi:hypothetical protein
MSEVTATMSRRVRWARILAFVVGVGFAVAAAVSAVRPFGVVAETQSARWPLFAADAATLALVALLAFAGSLAHPATLAEGSVVLFAYFFANYESESVVIPGIAVAGAALAFAYFRAGGGIPALGPRRIVMLGLSTLFALASIIAMQAPGAVLEWQHVRTASGGVEFREIKTTGDCAVYESIPKDIDEIDSGCAPIISARRARYVIGYSAASALLALIAIAGASRRKETGS